MTEQPTTGEHHRYAQGVGSCNDLVVTDGTSRLDDQTSPCFCGLFDTVWEGKEGIRGEHTVPSPLASTAAGDANGFHAACLARAYSNGS